MVKQRNMASVFLVSGERILLLFREGSRVANQRWIASAGGHFEPGEINDAEACALREMKEELGILPTQLSGLRLRYITLRNTGGEIRINYFFFAELSGGPELPLQSNEGRLQWFDLAQTAGLRQTFSGGAALEHYREVGRFDHALYAGVSDGEKVIFTKMAEG